MPSSQALGFDEQQGLRECEDYVQRFAIQQILRDCIVQLCVSRPDNPITFLKEYFQKLERVRDKAVLASAPSSQRNQVLGRSFIDIKV